MSNNTNNNGFNSGLPANPDAEKVLLAAVLLDNRAFYEIAEYGLELDDFSLDSHQRIYLRMSELMDSGQAVDIVTLSHQLAKYKEVEAVGGVAYIASLTEGVPRRPAIAEYLRIVRDKSMARRIMKVARDAYFRAADQSDSAAEVLTATQDQMQGIYHESGKGHEVQEIIVEEVAKFDAEADAPMGELLGCNLLTPDMDKLTSGLMEGELCLLAARPGQGKTEGALQIIVSNLRKGKRIYLQSLEMKRTPILRRLWRLIAKVPVAAMRDPRCLTSTHRQYIRKAQEELSDLPLMIDDTHELTTGDFRSRAILAAKRWKADLIVVDYAQLLLVPRARSIIEAAPKQAEALRHVARDYCRTIALAQLRRTPPNDLNRYPDIEDILGSSAFEQAAQMILMFHRTRENKLYTGEDYCFLGKMREMQQLQPFGIKAEPWGEFVDRHTEE